MLSFVILFLKFDSIHMEVWKLSLFMFYLGSIWKTRGTQPISVARLVFPYKQIKK